MTTQIRDAVQRDVLADYVQPQPGLAQRSFAALAASRAESAHGGRRLWMAEAGALVAGMALALMAVITIELLSTGTRTLPSDGLRPAPTDVSIVDGTFISGDSAWVMAQRYEHNGPTALFKTSDGGRSWSEQLLIPDGSGGPVEMRFWPDGQGMVVWGESDVSQYQVFRTRDGGANWESFKGSTNGLQLANFWWDSSHAWRLEVADPRRPTVLIVESTADGGRTWSESGRVPVVSGRLSSAELRFSDQSTGWLTFGTALKVTHDGGRSWTGVEIQLPSDATGQDVQLSAPVFFGGADGLLQIHTMAGNYVLTTSVGGSRWSGHIHLPGGPEAGGLFLSQRHWMLADGDTLRETIDGGTNWSERRVVAFGFVLNALALSSDGKAIWSQVGANGMVRSSDGGLTWTAVRLPGADDFTTSRSAVTALSECPQTAVLEPGPNAEAMARAAAASAAPTVYWNKKTLEFRIVRVYPADPLVGAGAAAYSMCGATVGSRTWVVELAFPGQPAGDLSAVGVLFVSRFGDGWKVWYRYG